MTVEPGEAPGDAAGEDPGSEFFRASPKPMLVLDSALRVVQANDAARLLFGPALTHGSHLPDWLVNGEESTQLQAQLAHGGASVSRFEASVRSWDCGDLMVAITTFPLPSGGHGMLVRDLTAEQRADTRIVQAEKLAGVGRMAAQLAHQLNTPLAAILLSAQAMEDFVRGSPVAADLGIIEDEARRCQLIVRRVQNFARAPGVWDDRVNLCHLFHRVHQIVRHRLDAAGVKLVFDIQRGRYLVRGDPAELEHVVFALIENAVDISPRGSTIRIEMRIAYEGGKVWFRVLDEGPGIGPEVAHHLFEPFFTTKDEGKGTGLGLFIARRILTRHGGAIGARNRPGGGAEFEFELPISPLLALALRTDPAMVEVKAIPFEVLAARARGEYSAGCEVVGILGRGRRGREEGGQ